MHCSRLTTVIFQIDYLATGCRQLSGHTHGPGDAASPASRMRVFTWDDSHDIVSEMSKDISENFEEDNFVTEPGLTSYAPTGKGAGESLSRLVDAAKKLIPKAQWSSTPFFVLSTAGVHVLPAGDRESVLENVCEHLKNQGNSPFSLRRADVISEEEEAIFGFMPINIDNDSYTDPGD
eukprot:scaffold92490_cov62-Attheya_sp.AAC.1